LFSNLSLIYSDYYYGLKLDFVGFDWNSGIRNFNLKYDFKHYISNNFQLNYGLNEIYYKFNPGEIEPSNRDSGIVAEKLIDKYANKFAVYADIEQRLAPKLNLRYGLRISSFIGLGQDRLNVYKNDNPVLFNQAFQIYEKAKPIGEENYRRSDHLSTFINLEPRISLAFSFNRENSIKASYNRMAQYLHLL